MYLTPLIAHIHHDDTHTRLHLTDEHGRLALCLTWPATDDPLAAADAAIRTAGYLRHGDWHPLGGDWLANILPDHRDAQDSTRSAALRHAFRLREHPSIDL